MKAGRSSLRRRMLFTLLGCFVPMVVVISLLFVRSFLAQRQADIEALRYAAEDIRVTLDRFADGVYSVSDAFSTDERLIELLDRDYSADPLAKQYAVTYANNALFESYSRLIHQEKIAAIYLPARREVFDFRDPNQVTTLLVKQFEAMQVDASDKLGRFFFYPLQKNFLSTETYGEARRDMVVLVLVPTRELLASSFSLYFQILGVVVLCLVVFAVLIWHFYRRFMAPLAQLEQAMRQADAGDLKAYVKPQGPAEVVRMMEGYNAMLDSLRVGIEQQMEMQRRRQDLEMQVLMSQINPHFLYNTLESIVWKAGEAGRPDIGKLASSLGKLYRLSISGGLFVPLEQELEHVQMYMNIQRSRYGNKVDYEVRLHRVDPDGVEVLKLILQPIVENSLLYGMDGLDHTLRIRVAAWRRGEKLILTVTDNGVGMDKAALAALRGQIIHGRRPKAEANYRSTGIGLHNIGARLRLYAGSSSCIRVQSKPGFGTRVTLELPWRGIS